MSFFLSTFAAKLKNTSKMRNVQLAVLAITGLVVLAGCKEKKQSQDIIAPRLEVKKPSAPIRMQTYSDQRSVQWLGKEYKIEVKRTPDDSLRLVKDETGQQFVDNRIALIVRRTDGSIAIQKTFTKAAFENTSMPPTVSRASSRDWYLTRLTTSNWSLQPASACLRPTNTYPWK